MFKKIYNFFDKVEDKNRAWLSRRTILYSFIGGTGVVLFWRGVWHFWDYITALLSGDYSQASVWWDGPLSIAVGSILLLSTGLMVSTFIGNEVIISGLKKEKKIAEKTEEEVQEEISEIEKIKKELKLIEEELSKKNV